MPISQEIHVRIVDALKLGMPLGNVADFVKIPLEELKREMVADPALKAAIDHAIAECMHSRLKTLAGLKNWQALAFILQSLWPRQFGRTSAGRRRSAKRPRPAGDLDLTRLSEQERDYLDDLLARAHGRNRRAGSEIRVSVAQRAEPKALC